jgi:hypothetical protein
MKPRRIAGATRVVGVDQAYIPLAIRDEVIECGPPLGIVSAMTSEWLPTPEEIEAINRGAPVRLTILGKAWPPVLLEVSE